MKYFPGIFYLFCSILPFLLGGCTPIVTIIAPANGDTFEAGEEIVFEGKATDPQHSDLTVDAFVWTSDKDGEIGTGASFMSSDLSKGVHTITLTVTDPNGQAGQSSVKITISNDNNSTTTTAITPGDRFKDNGDGTVSDKRTGLIWLKNANPCPKGKNWADAGTYCNSLKSGDAGLTDESVAGQWRLPSVQELEGVGTDPPMTYCLDASCYECPVPWTMPGEPFTDVQSSFYWSSTGYDVSSDYAWIVSMRSGSVSYGVMSYGLAYVWPVRGGN